MSLSVFYKSKYLEFISNLCVCAQGKGKIISKANYLVLFYFKKEKKKQNISKILPQLLGQKFFIRFLEELWKRQFPSEMIWPLDDAEKIVYQLNLFTVKSLN